MAFSSFASNISRSSTLLAIPAYAALTATFLTEAKEQIEKELLGDDRSNARIRDNQQELTLKISELFKKKLGSSTPQEQAANLSRMSDQCEYIFEKSGPGYERQLEMLLKSILIQLWVSIEVMIGDLWELVVNEHPSHLASLLGKGSQSEKGGDKKSMPLDLLEHYNFNVSAAMGTILRNRFNFTVLLSAKEAYTLAFRDDGKDIQEAISSDSLRGLAAVRHLLVHKGGVVDETFLKDSSGVSSLDEMRSLGAGKQIFMDGVTFKKIVEPALLSAINLIKAVDAWLLAHPQTHGKSKST